VPLKREFLRMPNKYPKKKDWKVSKQKYTITNWADYNQALRLRGDITVWMTEKAIRNWYEPNPVYNGTGAPKVFTDFAIRTCHEIRLVYRLPLRQCQGFINALFSMQHLSIQCPDYSTLSKRLSDLQIRSPRYTKRDCPDESVHAIAIDSTGLKRFGRGEWHNEKYELSTKASWRKLHVAVAEDHYIEGCTLTDRFHSDESQAAPLLAQIDKEIDHFTADGAYDKGHVYDAVATHSISADIIIPPKVDAVLNEKNHAARNQNLQEIQKYGRMEWQKMRHYGRRNHSELAMYRYKTILGNSLHAREFQRQQQEAMIGSGVLNKMTSLGMPISHRIAQVKPSATELISVTEVNFAGSL